MLLQDGYEAHTHGGIIGLFGQHYVKTGKVSSDDGKLYSQLFELRQTGDYDDWKVVTENDIIPLVSQAKEFRHHRDTYPTNRIRAYPPISTRRGK